jgi:N-acetylglutamate synthase-like GNAT family acetyltransferase
MEIRAYRVADKASCLGLMDSNMPEYFTAEEREDFEAWLDAPQGHYRVAEHDGCVVGCGGMALERADLASLTWLMVAGHLRGQGLGRFLLFYLMKDLPAGVTHVRLATIPPVAGFFEKQGFRAQSTGAKGVEMIKKLQVCS